jgi:hypothetical protein
MRMSGNEVNAAGELVSGFDYDNQAWVEDGRYLNCGHPEGMKCGCYGRRFQGLTAREIASLSSTEHKEFALGIGCAAPSSASERHVVKPSDYANAGTAGNPSPKKTVADLIREKQTREGGR